MKYDIRFSKSVNLIKLKTQVLHIKNVLESYIVEGNLHWNNYNIFQESIILDAVTIIFIILMNSNTISYTT